jgi:hypothetical protein
MRTRAGSITVILALLLTLLLHANPARAGFEYPEKSLLRGYRLCTKENGDKFMLLIRDRTYSHGESGPFYDWHYVRSQGKLVFENGFLERRYGKVRRVPPSYASPVSPTLRNRSDGSRFARCVYTGGPS